MAGPVETLPPIGGASREPSSLWSRRDARGPQLVFSAPYLLVTLAVAFSDLAVVLQPAYLAAIGIVVALAVLSVVVPWHRYDRRWLPAFATLDIVALGMTRYVTPPTVAIAFLVVLPAMWFGLVYRWRGVTAATALTGAMISVPIALEAGESPYTLIRVCLLPFIAGLVAAAMALTSIAWYAQKGSLLRQRELLDAIINTVDVGILTIDQDCCVTGVNRKQVELNEFAYGRNPQRADEDGTIFGPDRVTPIPREERASVRAAGGETFSGYMMWIGNRRHGQRAISASARPLHGRHGEFEGAALVLHDVTDLMQALRVKDEFVAAVSHELRTPLTSIIGYAELMADYEDELPEVVTSHLAVVTRNAERLLALVSDLLTTAQVESGSLRLSLTWADVDELVDRSIATAKPRAAAANVQLVTEQEPLPKVRIDVGRVTQVIDNLLSNAIKYTPAGGTVTLSVRASTTASAGRQDPADGPGDGPGDGIALTVEDTGMGISEHDQAGLFTKFFRSSDVERQAIPGAGLGLVITKEIVEAHGGTVGLRSERGSGTTVTVRLPSS